MECTGRAPAATALWAARSAGLPFPRPPTLALCSQTGIQPAACQVITGYEELFCCSIQAPHHQCDRFLAFVRRRLSGRIGCRLPLCSRSGPRRARHRRFIGDAWSRLVGRHSFRCFRLSLNASACPKYSRQTPRHPPLDFPHQHLVDRPVHPPRRPFGRVAAELVKCVKRHRPCCI